MPNVNVDAGEIEVPSRFTEGLSIRMVVAPSSSSVALTVVNKGASRASVIIDKEGAVTLGLALEYAVKVMR